MPEHEELESAVAALALDATDSPEEEAEVRAHLVSCAACRELHARLSRAVEALPIGVAEARPPARLRDSILAAAASTPQRTAVAVVDPSPTILPLRRPGHPRAAVRRRWSLPNNGWAAAVAALTVALAGLGTWNVQLNQRVQDSAPVRYDLHGTGAMSGVQAQLTYFRRDGFSLVSFQNMPQPGDNQVYEVWTLDAANHPAPAGVFKPDGSGSYVLPMTRPLDGVKTIAVTIESGPSGSPVPTQQPQLAGQVN